MEPEEPELDVNVTTDELQLRSALGGPDRQEMGSIYQVLEKIDPDPQFPCICSMANLWSKIPRRQKTVNKCNLIPVVIPKEWVVQGQTPDKRTGSAPTEFRMRYVYSGWIETIAVITLIHNVQ